MLAELFYGYRINEEKFMVYADEIHLVTDHIEELHHVAAKIGLKREKFQCHSRHPHYDLWGSKRESALKNGAVVVGSKEIVRISHKLKGDCSDVICSENKDEKRK